MSKSDKQKDNSKKPWLFQPGQSGNIAGRPKKSETYSDTLREILEAKKINVTYSITGSKGTVRKKIVKVSSNKNMYFGVAAAMIREALKGNVAASREIVDRIQGRSKQTLHITEVENLDDKLTAAVALMDQIDESNGIDKPDTDSAPISEG